MSDEENHLNFFRAFFSPFIDSVSISLSVSIFLDSLKRVCYK